MRILIVRLVRVAIVVALGSSLACGSAAVDSPDGATPAKDSSADAVADATADSGICCPPDPKPSCCMKYGGWVNTGGCVATCDGMPQPNDPSWSLTTDSHGCSTWTNPKPNGGPGTCGAPTVKDASTDAPID